jgi:hypothetical protein
MVTTQDKITNFCRVPTGMPVSRYRAPKQVPMPSGVKEIPLIDPKKGPEHQLQLHYEAHVDTFNLGDDTDRKRYQDIWQMVCNGEAIVSESRTEFIPTKGSFIALLRWSHIQYKLPEAGGKNGVH